MIQRKLKRRKAPNASLMGGKPERASARRERALLLRKRGKSYRYIAECTGVSIRQAWNDVKRALKERLEVTKEDADQLRQLEVERLDRYLALLERKILRDPSRIETALRVQKRRAELLGLDAPKKTLLGEDSDNPLESLANRSTEIESQLLDMLKRLAER